MVERERPAPRTAKLRKSTISTGYSHPTLGLAQMNL
jgi:hypothetical protein